MRRRWVDLLMALFPPEFRAAREAELRQALEEERARRAARGRLAAAAFWARAGLDLAGSALRLRLRPVRPAPTLRRGGSGRVGWRTDLRHAARSLRATPVVTAVVVVTLAVGVGLNAALFTAVDAWLLRPLAYPHADRLVQVEARITVSGERERVSFTGGAVELLRESAPALEEVAAATTIRQNLLGAGLPRQVRVGWVSGNLMGMLGARPAVGRLFDEDDAPGAVVLGHALWRDQFGADPGVVGRGVTLDGSPHRVVGVLPPGFRLRLAGFPADDVELWKNPDTFWQNGDVWNDFQGAGILRVLARTRPGATGEELEAQLAGVAAEVGVHSPELGRADLALAAHPLQEIVVAEARPALLLLMGAVAAVLLIACANVTGLLLVRAQERVRELAVRRALGASRAGLLRLLLLEGLLLALAGGAAGLALAEAAVRAMVAWGPPLPYDLAVDGRVLAFALAACLGVTLAVGLVPALGGSRADPARELRGTRTATGSGRLRAALVVGQIAVSLVLLVGAGLLTGSLARLRGVEPGFRAEGVLTFAVSLPGVDYAWPEETGRFLVELEERLEGLPGVRSAGIMWPVPLSGSRWSGAYRAGDVGADGVVEADYRVGTAGYFETLEVPLLEGRLHRPDDVRHAVVVSRRVAERAWPGQPAVGRSLEANPWGGGDQTFEVIGVVEDVRYGDLREEPRGALYFDVRGWSWADWEFDVVARTEGPPAALLPAAREALADLDPEIPMADAAPLADLVERQTRDARFALGLVGLFGAVAGTLALLGLYAVVAHAVERRSREIGIRVALGSARASIAGLVLRQAVGLVALGVALGLGAAAAVSRLLAAFLYEVEPREPSVYAATALALAALALLATWLPARRAARLDPVQVLRAE